VVKGVVKGVEKVGVAERSGERGGGVVTGVVKGVVKVGVAERSGERGGESRGG
jgi:hypothetical protein